MHKNWNFGARWTDVPRDVLDTKNVWRNVLDTRYNNVA